MAGAASSVCRTNAGQALDRCASVPVDLAQVDRADDATAGAAAREERATSADCGTHGRMKQRLDNASAPGGPQIDDTRRCTVTGPLCRAIGRTLTSPRQSYRPVPAYRDLPRPRSSS